MTRLLGAVQQELLIRMSHPIGGGLSGAPGKLCPSLSVQNHAAPHENLRTDEQRGGGVEFNHVNLDNLRNIASWNPSKCSEF